MEYIQEEVIGSSIYLTYRGMWNLLQYKYKTLVSRDQVMPALKTIDL